jgi:hypothetical protein
MRKRNSWAARRQSRREIGRARGLASQRIQRENRATSLPDAETAMRRALDDARGQTIDEGRDWIGGKERHWLIRRSIHGRTNQVDVVINGTLWRTGALVHARYALKWGKWPQWGYSTKKPIAP